MADKVYNSAKVKAVQKDVMNGFGNNGGEEFLIVMPETSLEEAARAMTRVQRELTTHFFTANDQRLFITFSAGVAIRNPHESQDSVVKRADKAMYEAKKSGKNRVVTAQ